MPTVDAVKHGDVAVITLNGALQQTVGAQVRAGLLAAIAEVTSDPSVRGMVILFALQSPADGGFAEPQAVDGSSSSLSNVLAAISTSRKPIIAAVDGPLLGEALDLVVFADRRIVTTQSTFGFPETKWGLIPRAETIQRLPRIVGPTAALRILADGEPRTAADARSFGLADEIAPQEDLLTLAIQLAKQAAASEFWRKDATRPLPESARPQFEDLAKEVTDRYRGQPQIAAVVACLRAGFTLSLHDAEALGHDVSRQLLQDARSRAVRYASRAEQESARVPFLNQSAPARRPKTAAIIGGGTMGAGIAVAFLDVGIPTRVIETDPAAASRAADRIDATYQASVRRGKLSDAEKAKRLALLSVGVGLETIGEADVIVEAALEEMPIKRDIFSALDRAAKDGAVLATNTSYLNVDEIASATETPSRVLGMHFFSPANVMNLVEVVRGRETSAEALQMAVSTARVLGKVPVVVGVCHGFVGNRMLTRRSGQVDRLMLEGALPHQIDAALTDFGFRMGPCAMSDLAGLDISWRMRKSTGIKASAADAVFDSGRLGQKNGRGYFQYPNGARVGVEDPEVAEILQRVAEREGVTRRSIAQEEILRRLIYPMVNEGARILEEGIASRPSDIDVIWLNGYNWPRWRGGPMYFADETGLANVARDLELLAEGQGDPTLRPARLLAELAAEGRGFQSFAQA